MKECDIPKNYDILYYTSDELPADVWSENNIHKRSPQEIFFRNARSLTYYFIFGGEKLSIVNKTGKEANQLIHEFVTRIQRQRKVDAI
jgi:hypothetical protein